MHGEFESIVGIDEAGRGPLAGPVAVGAVLLYPDFDMTALGEIKNKDSKKLSPEKRQEWFIKIQNWQKEGKLLFHVELVSHTIIDTKGISFAIKKGIRECLDRIDAHTKNSLILLDGSLKAPKEFRFQKTIIKGDEKEQVIGLTSIAAKVTRDEKMRELAQKFPKYKFDIHKGYGTALHLRLIQKFGPSKIHRQSFISKVLT
jgi:ribonuclease HII